MYSKFKQLGKDSIVYGLGGAITKFFSFLLLPIYTRAFSPSDYGVLDVIATMTTLAGIVLTAGTETALSYYYYKLNNKDEQKRTITSLAVYLIAINALVAVLVAAFARPISQITFGDPEFAIFLQISVLSIPFAGFTSLNLNICRLEHKPWTYLSLTIPHFVLALLLNVWFVAIQKTGIIAVFAVQLGTAILFALISSFINRRFFGLLFSRERLNQLLSYGLPLVISGLSMWTINYLDRYFLLRYYDLEEIGLYGVGLRIASVVVFITQAFRTANAPFQFEVSSDKSAAEVYSRTLTYFALFTSLLCVPLSLFARPVIYLLATYAYLDAYKVVPLAVYSAVAYGMYQIVGVGLLVQKKTGFTGIAIGLGALINIFYLFWLVPPLGMVGAALATLLTHITVVAILYIGAQRAYPIPYDLGRIFRIFASAGAVITAGMLNTSQDFWSSLLYGILLSLLFLLSIPVLSLLDASEKALIQDRLRMLARRGKSSLGKT